MPIDADEILQELSELSAIESMAREVTWAYREAPDKLDRLVPMLEELLSHRLPRADAIG